MNKRLTEQYDSKQNKHVLSGIDVNKEYEYKKQIQELSQKIVELEVLESAYNSDKKMFYLKLDELQNQIKTYSNSNDLLNDENKKLRSENNTLSVKLKMLSEINDNLKLESERLKDASKDRIQILESSKYLHEQIERLNTELNLQDRKSVV